ncbi:Hydroxylysine kinase [Chlorella vulgaris]
MRPQVTPETATDLAIAHWHLAGPLNCTQLDGYDDRNYRLTGQDGRSWVFKIHNAADSLPEAQFAEAQNALLGLLVAAGFAVTAPLAQGQHHRADDSFSDGFTLRIRGEDGTTHAARLLTWLPGDVLETVEQSAALYKALGGVLGQVDAVLMGCDLADRYPALRRKFDWNTMQLPATYARVREDLLGGAGVDVQLLDQVVALFDQATSAADEQLRRSIIHSDANERNVLANGAAAAAAAAAEQRSAASGSSAAAAAASTGGSFITGLIDWSDACLQWLAQEPATCAAYCCLLPANINDPLPAAAAVVAGYERELPLLKVERRLLRTLMMGRLALSLALGAQAAALQPDNAAYLLQTQKNGWRLLRLLADMSDATFAAAVFSTHAAE